MKIKIEVFEPVTHEVEVNDSIIEAYLRRDEELDRALSRPNLTSRDYQIISEKSNLVFDNFKRALKRVVGNKTLISFEINKIRYEV